jgi:peptide chain release factor subunit 1
MARAITWDDLRDLASFEAGSGYALSLYVNLDPSIVPTPSDADPRFNALLDEAGRWESRNGELSHEEKLGLREDIERIRRYVENEFERDGAQGLALFCAGSDDVWRPLTLVEPVPDKVCVDRRFLVAPLVPLVGRGAGAFVAVAGREQGLILRLRGGRLEEVVDLSDEQPRRHDQGGWSQARFQRHVDELAAEHLREVADMLDRLVRSRRGQVDVVVVAPEESRAELGSYLSAEVQGALAGWASAESHASPAELLELVEPIFAGRRAEHEREVLDRWRAAAGRGDGAASGWAATLTAASDGRVDTLLVKAGADRPAHRCPKCGRAELEPGECPLDGTPLEETASGVDAAVHQTLRYGGTVAAIEIAQDLDPVEGIAALLRF